MMGVAKSLNQVLSAREISTETYIPHIEDEVPREFQRSIFCKMFGWNAEKREHLIL